MQVERNIKFNVRLSSDEIATLWNFSGDRQPQQQFSLSLRPIAAGVASFECASGRVTLMFHDRWAGGSRRIHLLRHSAIYKNLVRFVLNKIRNPEFVRQNLAKNDQTKNYSSELINTIAAQLERVGTSPPGTLPKISAFCINGSSQSRSVIYMDSVTNSAARDTAGEDGPNESAPGVLGSGTNRLNSSSGVNGSTTNGAPEGPHRRIDSSEPETPAAADSAPASDGIMELNHAAAPLAFEDLPIFEIEFEDEPEPEKGSIAEKELRFTESFRFVGLPQLEPMVLVDADGDESSRSNAMGDIRIRAEFACDSDLADDLVIYAHWGEYRATPAGPAEAWTDEEIAPKEISQIEPGRFVLVKAIHPLTSGAFGVTFYAHLKQSKKAIWCGKIGENDFRFDYLRESEQKLSPEQHLAALETLRTRSVITRGLASFDRFVATVSRLTKEHRVHGLGKVIFDITKDEPYLRRLVSSYYMTALEIVSADSRPGSDRVPLTHSRRSKIEATLRLLQTLGIGEIAIVSPEGPHAIAGGLAQVVVGLSNSLANWGVSTTIISPLYEESQGNKHKSAEQLLRDGIRIRGATVPVNELGEIRVRFGPTQLSGTNQVKTFAKFVTVSVYEAAHRGVRCIFLRHRDLADRLYPKLSSDDELRRAVFLCRGALEVIKDKRFDVSPHILISNDWMTGLVPAYLQCERRYSEDDRLNTIETIHTIHNCGRAYQGRIYVNQFGEDLWPLLGIKNEHFFGLADPNDHDFLNLTAGAIKHVKKAILTVSRPYSEQLLNPEGGDGLENLLRTRADCIFGISNGIDAVALRNIFWQFGEHARHTLNRTPLVGGRFEEDPFFLSLPEYKGATKHLIQQLYGLAENPDAVLISLIGRLAEQKGISLLTERTGPDRSLLESVLNRYPNVQLLIGGPPAPNDPSVIRLREEIDRLTVRFPGRISAVFEFIHHEEALKITQASELFLMPSRYEPGGITQLEALAAGTLVIARNVGGIRATISNYEERLGRGNGFLFSEYSGVALRGAIARAIEVTRDVKRLHALGITAARAHHDWSERVPKYLALFQHVAGVVNSRHSFFQCLDPQLETLESIRPDRAVLARWLKAPYCPISW